jgi:ethanolamine permease
VKSENTAPGASLKGGTAGPLLLTGLGLAYLIVGDYVSWGFALASGGVGGALVGLAIATLMFLCLTSCLSELAAMMPSAGGAHQFIVRGLGSKVGHLAGAAILLEFICGTAALASVLTLYMTALTGLSPTVTILSLFALVSLLHIRGVGEALVFTMVTALLAVLGICAFLFTMLPHVSTAKLLSIVPQGGHSVWFPFGWTGVWSALAFVVTFYITLEGVAFAAEEAARPERNVPIAMFLTLMIAAMLATAVIVMGPAGVGATAIAGAADPIAAAMGALAVKNAALLTIANAGAISALVAGFFGGMYASSRLLFHMARQRLLPAALQKVNSRQAPWVAVLTADALGIAVAISGHIQQLIVIFAFGATVVYVLLFAAHWQLRRTEPAACRPFRSLGGVLLPATGIVLALVIFVACFLADPKWSGVGVVILVIATLYFRAQDLSPRAVVSAPPSLLL